MTILKWIAWALLVLPVSFLIGIVAGGAAQAWNVFIMNALFGE